MSEGAFRHAIVRPPGRDFASGLTTAGLGVPDLALAMEQHGAYRAALARLGVEVEILPADDAFPDSTFVEDAAVLADGCAVLTRPGAPSRRGEVASIRQALAPRFPRLAEIAPPGTLDGGDVCETETCVLIGVSTRTNPEGARQLQGLLAGAGRDSRTVDIRAAGLLHLKTALSPLGDGRLLVGPQLDGREELAGFEPVRTGAGEAYAANAVRVRGAVLLAAGFPRTAARLRGLGFDVVELAMSEFLKMDGGLSCLSLRF